jgi:endonuclease YncB( thermonuclease family)
VSISKTASSSSDIEGLARVIDGDTIVINSQRIRLYGIDAPEKKQTCKRHIWHDWPCGKVSTERLRLVIGLRRARCDIKSHDRYGRSVAVCYVGKTEINQWMVKNGFAVAYRKYGGSIYDNEETFARSNKLGIWDSDFDMPWEWRKK